MAGDGAVLLPGVLPGVSAEPTYRFLSPHQAAVVDAAARRLVPVTRTDPLGHHPGAHDAHVSIYVDHLLSVFQVAPRHLRAAGSLRQRVADLRHQYINGIALLDQEAGGDFTAVLRLRQHLILSQSQLASFASLLFDHIVEAKYAAPESAGPRVMPRHVNRCDHPPSGIAMA